MKKAEFDLFAAEYLAMHEKSLGSFGVNQEYFAEYKISDVAAELQKLGLFVDTKKVLDFGAGCGNSIPYFRKYLPDATLTCLDVSEESLNIGRGNFPFQAEFMHFDGTNIPVAADSFDLAFSACVFHHIDHDEHVSHLVELRRVVRNNGVLIIFEHNPINPFTLHVVNQCPFDKNARLIRSSLLAERVVKAGFLDVEVRYRLFLPPSLHKLRFIERFLSWLPLGAQYYVVARKSSGA
jgi:SAM-dependent methyltransferase